MKILVTAGSTQVPIDKVRAITNIFKGKTGAQIAEYFSSTGSDSGSNKHEITLLTSNRDHAQTLASAFANLKVLAYRTFDELLTNMGDLITKNQFDLIIHSAAISDYRVSEVFEENEDGTLIKIATDAKIPSGKILLWRLTPTEKIVDKIRKDWGFTGHLVMFKLQVGISDDELIGVAKKSMERPNADLIVANCLEWSGQYAYVISRDGAVTRVERQNIAQEIESRLK